MDPWRSAEEGGRERQVPQARLDDTVHRILRSMFATAWSIIRRCRGGWSIRSWTRRRTANRRAKHRAAEESGSSSPLAADHYKSIAVIGSHADVGVLSGGGSAQMDAPGGNAINPKQGASQWQKPVYFPSAPLKYIREKARAPGWNTTMEAILRPAAVLAKSSELAIVFVNQYMSEDRDAETSALPNNQDALVRAVAAANPHSIVALETGGPVSMPWVQDVKAISPRGIRGSAAGRRIANILLAM